MARAQQALRRLDEYLAQCDEDGHPRGRRVRSLDVDGYELVPRTGDGHMRGNVHVPVPGMIGKGSFGEIWRCRDPDGAVVAVKELDKQAACRKAEAGRVIVEVAVLRNLRHPALPRLRDVLHTDARLYIALELGGGNLYEFIIRQSPKRLGTVPSAVILKQLLGALAYCHKQGVVHRDVKPENILIARDADPAVPSSLRAKLIDFGLAKYCGPRGNGGEFPASPALQFPVSPALQSGEPAEGAARPAVMPAMLPASLAATASHTPGGSVAIWTPGGTRASPVACTPCGTNLYRALESIEGELVHRARWLTTKPHLAKLDVWAAGCVAYAMLFGRLPYSTDQRQTRPKQLSDLKRKQRKHLHQQLEFPLHVAQPPDAALEVVRGMLLLDVARRLDAARALGSGWLTGTVLHDGLLRHDDAPAENEACGEQRVRFEHVQPRMRVRMVPEGCAPGRDFYTGVVVSVDADAAVVRWDDPGAGGPPAAAGVPAQRAERREWWSGRGAPHKPPPRDLPQSPPVPAGVRTLPPAPPPPKMAPPPPRRAGRAGRRSPAQSPASRLGGVAGGGGAPPHHPHTDQSPPPHAAAAPPADAAAAPPAATPPTAGPPAAHRRGGYAGGAAAAPVAPDSHSSSPDAVAAAALPADPALFRDMWAAAVRDVQEEEDDGAAGVDGEQPTVRDGEGPRKGARGRAGGGGTPFSDADDDVEKDGDGE